MKTLEELRGRGCLVDRDGAVWFETPEARALDREGEEGRAVIRSHGDPTYLGTDIAYHRLCLEERGIDLKINVWGPNTHDHLLHMKIALPALGIAEQGRGGVVDQHVCS